ncbi:hypothetical protein ACFC7P_12490 [Enterococcus faecalis]|uniref:hypothetical protein n=1 Tax=Enterococcus faecalis TaxID=1351 RepID=UPI0035E26D3A
MGKRPIYLPVELQDVFELIENGEVENLYFEEYDCLSSVVDEKFDLEELKNTNFYIKQDYTPIENQEVEKNETN